MIKLISSSKQVSINMRLRIYKITYKYYLNNITFVAIAKTSENELKN